jgi:chemotaxis methyl-accepting protein methylase
MGYEGLSKYFTRYELENPQRDPELIKNVEFIHHNILNDNLPGNNDLVLYRNRFIYFNPGLQSKMMSRIYDTMKKGGVLSLGVQEKLDSGFTEKFAVLNKAENVFRKK